ncbi:PspA/IM30 family protein [Paenibacillus sp. 1011MAR3C5]|uniref:PspA/IM30 family protein n=1 Tax=Paenibacillus sp. 1011MAR3C5 TaxID=1675787 RepID=UPI000E6C498F|nr:PspA/IM30 family protein [Paenibacillus sp. 1011MAR3C5]RJE83895.1 PspA/IM30 family protein [Paenibacillus sp. 1011MAR3C5]
MGILSRFKTIMSSNVNASLNRSEDPAKALNEYMRSLNSDLGKVKAEMASMVADESRARRELDECQAEIRKLQRYAEKMVQDGRDDEALRFLEMKAAEAKKEISLQSAYDQAAANVKQMRQLQDKLSADVGAIEARVLEAKGRLAASQSRQNMNGASLGALEEKAEQAYYEALAIAELHKDESSDLDERFAELERSKAESPADELAELKNKQNNRD